MNVETGCADMDDEKSLVSLSMDMFSKMRLQTDNLAVANYLRIIPDQLLQGSAQHLARQFMNQRRGEASLTEQQKTILSIQICQQIFDEIIRKARQTTASNENLDGAELFYRRALNHMTMERYSDAERMLRRSVEIYPDFVDGWDALAEVLDRNGKPDLAEQARMKASNLKADRS